MGPLLYMNELPHRISAHNSNWGDSAPEQPSTPTAPTVAEFGASCVSELQLQLIVHSQSSHRKASCRQPACGRRPAHLHRAPHHCHHRGRVRHLRQGLRAGKIC